ncbi:hypothetical protein DFH09DRAFT_1076204 [Mycena vulgaris]|nr:hypothetical protein DFH09DRAFT_1076204 [Mycena vulgaris]
MTVGPGPAYNMVDREWGMPLAGLKVSSPVQVDYWPRGTLTIEVTATCSGDYGKGKSSWAGRGDQGSREREMNKSRKQKWPSIPQEDQRIGPTTLNVVQEGIQSGPQSTKHRGHRLYHVNRECHIVRTSQEKRQPTNRDIGGLSRCGAANNVWNSQPQRSVKAAIRTTFWGTGEIGLWVREQNLDERSYDHMFSIGELARPFREKINELDPQR